MRDDPDTWSDEMLNAVIDDKRGLVQYHEKRLKELNEDLAVLDTVLLNRAKLE